ncbi:MAG: fumarylacetoacetase [Saprospiraceae bacterium]
MNLLNSWISISKDSDFSIYNLPFGIFSIDGGTPRVGIAIGDSIVDLAACAEKGWVDVSTDVLNKDTLNDFISLGKPITNKVRLDIQKLLCDTNSPLKDNPHLIIKQSQVTMHMPVYVGDYTDFYSSIEHATNVGTMFRGPDKALMPNWKHLPVGYHGRASSIIVSDIPIHRPKGQVMPLGADLPIFKASGKLDFELEMVFIIGKENTLGTSISTAEAKDHIFGMVLFNDWSARDIQKWEYVPLGPFLGKSFASSASPWVVTLEALEHFKVPGPTQKPEVQPYLQYEGLFNYDINLSVGLTPKNGNEKILSESNFKYMYWNMPQQLAHHTINGCNVRVGDFMASGTISGPDESSYGSMLELSWGGKKPIRIDDNNTRTFVEDGDTITLKGHALKDEIRVGFGEVKTKVLP